MYALTTHTSAVSLNARSVRMDGSATFTMVVSSTIMSTPRQRTRRAHQRRWWSMPWDMKEVLGKGVGFCRKSAPPTKRPPAGGLASDDGLSRLRVVAHHLPLPVLDLRQPRQVAAPVLLRPEALLPRAEHVGRDAQGLHGLDEAVGGQIGAGLLRRLDEGVEEVVAVHREHRRVLVELGLVF